jgi:dTDP-L-rhamnose 4-epimerase
VSPRPRSDSRVLVTGGAGFVGSHLVDLLLARGERVRVLDNLDPLAHPSGRPEHLDGEAELVVGDLRDGATVERALEGVERVFHLGGVVGNGESMVNVRRAVDHNAGGTATLLEAVVKRRDRIRRLVAASSMVVYGEGSYRCEAHGVVHPALRSPERLRRREWEPSCPACGRPAAPVPTREDAPLRPTSVYGITKRDQEELVLVLGRAYGVETVALRYLNVYGPRQALGNPYTGVAAIFAARILNGRRPLVFEDGAQIRDLVHVSDVVRATALAMDAPAAAGHAVNVATGRRVGILDLAGRIAAALGSDLEPELTGEFRAGDIRHCFADVSRARELLGFEARTALDDGLPELAEWMARSVVPERGDAALAELRSHGLVG